MEKPKFDIPKFEFFGPQDSLQNSLVSKEPLGLNVSREKSTTGCGDEELPAILNDKLKIITRTNLAPSGNAVSLLQKTFNGESSKASPLTREVDSAWLDRIQHEEAKKSDPAGLSQDSGLELSQGLSASQPGSGSDSEDLIYDSDSESQSTSSINLMKSNCTLSTSASLNSSQLSGCCLPLMNIRKSIPAESTLLADRNAESNLGSQSFATVVRKEVGPSKLSVSNEDCRPTELSQGPLVDHTKRPGSYNEFPPAKRARRDSEEEPVPSGTLPEIAAASKKRTAKKQAVQSDPGIDKKMAALEKKLQSGKANENFVSINIQKKVFVRGKKTTNFSKYKKQKWKQLKQENGSYSGPRGVLKCFKCGDVGHFSKACPSGEFLFFFKLCV